MSSRRSLALLSLALSSGLCVALEAARIVYSGTNDYRFLVWNLFLAWIPFGLALAVYDGHRRGRLRLGLAALWLLFFPNAPYIVTDFVHLQHTDAAPYWYDAVTVSAFAWTGPAATRRSSFRSACAGHCAARERVSRKLQLCLLAHSHSHTPVDPPGQIGRRQHEHAIWQVAHPDEQLGLDAS